ncbi:MULTISPECIES: geranylgeranyl reductase family protein [unclassified Pseudodesulfovibrio]|uniref:NAD(P)/FAD-dependent oxidoreductase n=1 Tax=unclassified Pseudodesulfovibrio TaxID=2661612 RepID=UPI000FEBB68C|nr:MULTISPECIES: geranylgeranyl reductase family protein [unclassified Pseudodesulfovibrio]MCJ2165633.1 geranylgeranyl reductase family protein [Pseudodesulfovibrio sp. S3-i]RWU03040.1 geranylgeranyl reductase family protein [Pseudodesulfovibrio sp. S3]
MTKTYDTIICGGSLAGSAAGISLARQGFSVAILDRERFPRNKLCGGLLTWKSIRLLESLFGETPESLTRSGAINHTSDRYSIRTLSQPLAEGSLSFPFHFVDRTLFDDLLLSRAREAGAEVFQETPVTACDPIKGVVTCRDGRTFQGRYVIGADGANSVVRNSFPFLDRDRIKRFMAPTIEIKVSKEALPRPLKNPELYVGFMNAGYGWVFPNRDRIIVGICGLRRNNINFSQVFKDYLDFLEIKSDAIPDLRGHPLPYGNYLENPVHGVTLLAGDAGGFVEPLLGEGIFFALCTGMYAGQAVAQALTTGTHPGTAYRVRLNRYVMPELKGSNILRWTLFRGVQWFGSASLRWFIRMAGTQLGDMVHGKRSYRWLRKKHWDF